jgi:hypothetical protein
MIRNCYRIQQGVNTAPIESKQTRHYNFENKLVKDCLDQLKFRHKVVLCFNQEQLDLIIDKCEFNLEYEWNQRNDVCRIWRKIR